MSVPFGKLEPSPLVRSSAGPPLKLMSKALVVVGKSGELVVP